MSETDSPADGRIVTRARLSSPGFPARRCNNAPEIRLNKAVYSTRDFIQRPEGEDSGAAIFYRSNSIIVQNYTLYKFILNLKFNKTVIYIYKILMIL